ncbi:uncharacterized protein K02A2.6-like [Mercenaria mercenaria]|uniref:uncharacterized protein K02A2.6-like n=1 Tax=Mercenaria mercenaria TaxID=6596 RepID=UPI00234F7BA3|nr:uncharacterized protein K02A2.6-like [Mercenaria mercenaria]
MYRNRRLMFGINCAPEIYNKVTSQVLSGLQGVNSIFDDIIVHGKDTAEHNVRLELLLTRLQEKEQEVQEENENSMCTEEYIRFVVDESTPVAMKASIIEQESRKDSELTDIQQLLKTRRWYETDNAQNFNSRELNEYLETINIEHRNTTPLWPQANGEIEIQNISIIKRIRIAHVEKKNLEEELQTYLMMYRSTPHTTTGVSPAEMLFRRKIRTKSPEISDYDQQDQEIRDRDSEEKEKEKIYAEERRNVRDCDIHDGDLVLVKQKEQNKLSTQIIKIICQY